MLTHDSGYRFSVGNSSGGKCPGDGWMERGAGSKSSVDSESHAPEEGCWAGGREQAAPRPPRAGCVKTTSAVSPGSALCLWGAKT